MRDEGHWPEGGAEGPTRGFKATRGGTGSTQSAEGSGTVFFVVGLVLESPVRSGYLPFSALTVTETG